MNKKSLIAILSLMVIIIIVAVVFMCINSVKETPENTQDTPVESEPDNTQDTPVENKPDNTQDTPAENKPANTQDTPAENKPDNTQDTPVKNKPDNTQSTSVVNTVLGYENLTIIKDKTPAEAYEYLNSFLNSDYGRLLNKENKVGSDYVPNGLVTVQGYSYKMESTAANALIKMLNDAKADGITDLVLYSGYRPYATQKNKFETRTQKYINQGYSREEAEKKAGEYIAPPGASEHHTGLAADVCSYASVSQYGYLSETFDQTKEYKWLSEHCTDYGFILRYKKDAEDITGYSYEPWHFRYIGVEHAKMCTEFGITYEEYYALLVKCRDQAKELMNKSE